MSKALEVVIKEPRVGWEGFTSRLVAGLIVTFVNAWIIYMLAPIVLGIDIGYWQAVGGLVLIRAAWPTTSFPYLRSTEKQKPSK